MDTEAEDVAGRLRVRRRIGEQEFEATGDQETVLELYEKFLGGLDRSPQVSQIADTDQVADELPLPVFLKQRDLDTNALRAAAIVVWAKRFEARQSLTPSEVKSYWQQTPLKPPGNLARDLGTAASQGWLRHDSSGSYATTGYGEGEIDSRMLKDTEG